MVVILSNLKSRSIFSWASALGQRLQTLSLSDIRNIHHKHNKIDIKITARIKTSGKNKPQPSLERRRVKL
nr:unnamed protein product [Callosobruchus chinensis]